MAKRKAPDLSVAGLKVLITAGAAGIGRAIAEAFADGGAHVEVCDVAKEALADLKKARPDIPGHLADVADPKAIARFFAKAAKGGLDVLVNNAGIAGPTAPIDEIRPEDWHATVDINLNSMFHCTRLAVPLLKKAGGGSIINLSSVAGRLGFPLRTPYAATKWAVVGLTKSLAMELGPHKIRVNAIQPGIVRGPRIDRVIAARAKATGVTFDQQRKLLLSKVSLRTDVTAEDVAAMALFLASSAGARISGQALSVCGNVETLG
ncbi:MAG: SDR family oxidoreductase [Alphaproteobacteria bacterium]|nr:SDR family oxidoreductase [Alphaproteobacteria bacterium]